MVCRQTYLKDSVRSVPGDLSKASTMIKCQWLCIVKVYFSLTGPCGFNPNDDFEVQIPFMPPQQVAWFPISRGFSTWDVPLNKEMWLPYSLTCKEKRRHGFPSKASASAKGGLAIAYINYSINYMLISFIYLFIYFATLIGWVPKKHMFFTALSTKYCDIF